MGCKSTKSSPPLTQKSIYEFTVKDIDGNEVSLSNYQGKVLIIVNVACGCGLTKKNYSQLNELYATFKDQGLEILAFPCNQFFGQESGSSEEIKDHVRNRLNAEFPLFDKVAVNGKNSSNLFRFLRQNSSLKGRRIGWNFGKFILDKKGEIVNYYGPRKNPNEFGDEIKGLLSH